MTVRAAIGIDRGGSIAEERAMTPNTQAPHDVSNHSAEDAKTAANANNGSLK